MGEFLLPPAKRAARRPHRLAAASDRPVGSQSKRRAPMTETGVLRFDKIVKSFGGTQALKGVSFEVRRGEIVALLGENGAGKSTVIKILSGIHKADSGAITLDGAPFHSGHGGSGHSVAFIHQDLGLIEWMTVAENVGLARGFARTSFFGRAGVIDWARCAKAAREALASDRLRHRPGHPHPVAEPDREVARRHRACARRRLRFPGARRADRKPAGRRSRAAVCRHAFD